MLKTNLTKLGLTENEAKTYLFLLENYKTKAADLAKYLKVTHPAAKKILDSMINKGLIRSQEYSKTLYYFAENGEKLVALVDKEAVQAQQKISEQLAIAEQTAHLLEQHKNISDDTALNVTYYKGKNGLVELSSIISKSKQKVIHEFVDTDLLIYNKIKDRSDFIKNYKQHGLQFDIIYTQKEGNVKTFLDDTDIHRLPREKVNNPTAQMLLFDDKVIFTYIGDDINGIMIENEWIANTLLTLFNNAKK